MGQGDDAGGQAGSREASELEAGAAGVNADDVAFFAGTGLTPTGKILAIDDVYVNLQPQTVRGVDLAFLWNSPRTKIGEFNVKLNATRLLEFQRDPGPVIDGLLDARSQGKINVATSLPEGKDLIRQGGRPEWRGSASLSWSEGSVQIGTFHQYIGNYDEIGFLDATGKPANSGGSGRASRSFMSMPCRAASRRLEFSQVSQARVRRMGVALRATATAASADSSTGRP